MLVDIMRSWKDLDSKKEREEYYRLEFTIPMDFLITSFFILNIP